MVKRYTEVKFTDSDDDKISISDSQEDFKEECEDDEDKEYKVKGMRSIWGG